MKTLLKFIVLTPVAVLLLAFAFANRQSVTVSFDPFAANPGAGVAVDAPLFVVLFLAAMLGVLAGGTATWLTQGRHRKAARRSRAEAERLRGEAEALRSARDGDSLTPTVRLPRRA